MADGGPTVYGAFDVGVLVRNHHAEVASGMNGHNGIGFKMSEDLGNGMTISGDAFFQFALDAGGNAAGAPDSSTKGFGGFNTVYSYLALSGDFGTVIGGRAGGARAGFIKQYDPFGGFGVGSALQAQQSAAGNADYADNVLAWVTPEVMPGLKFLAAYTSNLVGQDVATHADRSGLSGTPLYAIAALYNQGPISLTAAYENLSIYGSGAHYDVATGGASYDLGVAKVMGLYQYIEAFQHGWQVGATAPMGAATLKASYVNNKNSGFGASCEKVAVGVNYDLSKRTRVYADAAKLTEKDGCVTGINTSGGAYSTAPGTALDNNYGAGSYGMNVGVRHSF
jgi:predicted porin